MRKGSDLSELFNELVRLETELWEAVDAKLRKELDLPLVHFEPMSVMDQLPNCRVYDISSALAITTGGASKLVDRIEADGYCKRSPNPADRRSSLLRLTPEGRRVLEAARKIFDVEVERRMGSVPETTVRQFVGTLRRLRAAGKQADEAAV
jgi:DNA-binding MarR family transcriptional regulator